MREGCSLIGGLRRDKVTLSLSEPSPRSLTLSIPTPATDTLSTVDSFGDFEQNSWIPYIGLRIAGPNYRWRIIGSPFVATEVKLPLSVLAHFTSGGFFPLFFGYVQDRAVTWKYNFRDSSLFLESAFEYDVGPFTSAAIRFSPWVKGSWLHFNGGGELDASTAFADYFVVAGVPGPKTNHAGATSDTNTATLGRYLISFGVTAQLSF